MKASSARTTTRQTASRTGVTDLRIPPVERSPRPVRNDLGLPPPDAGEIAIPDGQYWVRVDEVKYYSTQPREFFESTEMAIFAAGIAEVGQENPVWLRRLDPPEGKLRYELIDGERRLRALLMNGTTHVLAIFKRPKDELDQFKKAVVANFGHSGHPPLEIARSIERLLKLPELQGMSYSSQIQKLTAVYCQSRRWLEYHHSLLRLHPDIQKQLHPALPKDQQMKVVTATYLATIPDQMLQLQIAAKIRSDSMSVKQALNYTRKVASRSGKKDRAGLSRRTPVDDYRPFTTFLRRLAEDTDIYTTMPAENFDAMIQSRPAHEISSVIAQLKTRSEQLLAIRRRVEKVRNAK